MNWKNLLVLLIILVFSQTIQAQEESPANPFVLGGSFSFLTQNNTYPVSSIYTISSFGGIYSNITDETSNVFFSFFPYVGKELNANWLVGLEGVIVLNNFTAEDVESFGGLDTVDLERKGEQIGIGLFARYMINPDNRFNFYLQPDASYNIIREEESRDDDVVQEMEANHVRIGVRAGILYNVSERWRLTLRIGGVEYINGSWEIVDTDNENDFSSFNANLDLTSLFFGVELKL